MYAPAEPVSTTRDLPANEVGAPPGECFYFDAVTIVAG
jgi:hypothetical protein